MFYLIILGIRYYLLLECDIMDYLESLGEDVVPAVEEDGEGEESRVLIYPADNGVITVIPAPAPAWSYSDI